MTAEMISAQNRVVLRAHEPLGSVLACSSQAWAKAIDARMGKDPRRDDAKLADETLVDAGAVEVGASDGAGAVGPV